MPKVSRTHVVIIPSYNPGPRGVETVKEAMAQWSPVWVVVDGSTDGTDAKLLEMAAARPNDLAVHVMPKNRGKGAAVLVGLKRAKAMGYTHALTMDADGQHPVQAIGEFMRASEAAPAALILGVPVFDQSAPSLRVKGRKISNWWANLETLWSGIGDSLFGFRVYPVLPLLETMESHHWMRRFDFDVEAAVRLCWRGLPLTNLAAPVRYFSPAEGGVSHFDYWRDNRLLTWMHLRLFFGFVLRLPLLLYRKLAR